MAYDDSERHFFRKKQVLVLLCLLLLALGLWLIVFPAPRRPEYGKMNFRHDISADCQKSLQRILAVDLKPFLRNPEQAVCPLPDLFVYEPVRFIEAMANVIPGSECRWGGSDWEVSEQRKSAQSSCETALEKRDPKKTDLLPSTFACFRAVMKLRYLISIKLITDSTAKAVDPNVLQARLFPIIFAEPSYDEGAVAAAAESVAELYGLSKENMAQIQALRLAIEARYAYWGRSGTQAEQTKSTKELESALKKLHALAPKNWLLWEVPLAQVAISGDMDALHDVALEAKRQIGLADTGDYYLAWSACKKGDADRTRWHLGKVLTRYPWDARAHLALSGLKVSARKLAAQDNCRFYDIVASLDQVGFEMPPQ